jgi:hypothetical protein
MDALDLDVNNYSIRDIERFFKYSPNTKYTAPDIELREAEIREQLLGSGHVDKKMKRDLIEFMKEARNRLIEAKCPQTKSPTLIPKNHTLDHLQYPVAPKSEPGREGNLIVRPDTQFVYTQECDYFPGVMNPLKTRVITRYLNVDTRFRKPSPQSSSTDFTFQLPMKLNKVVSMQLATFQMPYSFYGYSCVIGNNYLNISIIYINDGYDDSEPIQLYKTIIIPDGNYTIDELIATINEILSPKNPDMSLVNPNDYFSYIEFSFDTKTFKVTAKRNPTPPDMGGTMLDFIIDQRKNINGDDVYCSDITYKLGWSLGFTQELYRGSPSYVGEIVADIYNIKYIYFIIDDFNNSSNNHFINAFDESIMSPNILARISFQKNDFHLLTERDLNIITEPRKYFGPVDITRLKIKLLDDRGRFLDLNGADYSFCLSFKVLYDL